MTTTPTSIGIVTDSGLSTPPPSPAQCVHRAQSARSSSRTPPMQRSSDCPPSSASPASVTAGGNRQRPAAKSSLPLSRCNDVRRPGSARSAVRTPVEGQRPQQQQQRHHGTGGVQAVIRPRADDITAAPVSSSSDAYSDDATSSANDHTPTSHPPPPGLSHYTYRPLTTFLKNFCRCFISSLLIHNFSCCLRDNRKTIYTIFMKHMEIMIHRHIRHACPVSNFIVLKTKKIGQIIIFLSQNKFNSDLRRPTIILI